MGIKHLKSLLDNLCKTADAEVISGIKEFDTIDQFIKSEKSRYYDEEIELNKVSTFFEKKKIKDITENKPYFLAIDAHQYAVKYKRVFKDIEYGILRQTILSLSSKILPIYIFDGRASDQKKKTITERKQKKERARKQLEKLLIDNHKFDPTTLQSLPITDLLTKITSLYVDKSNLVNVNNLLTDPTLESDNYKKMVKLAQKSVTLDKNDITRIKNLLDLIGIPYLTADMEADDTIAILYKRRIIDACLSDDMDMLPKGCDNVIQINRGSITQYYLPRILKKIKLNRFQFVDLCILLGCDYYKEYLPKIRALELYKSYVSIPEPNIDSFVSWYSDTDNNILEHRDLYKETRQCFSIDIAKYPDEIKINLKTINWTDIIKYFQNDKTNFCKKIKYLIKNANNFIKNIPKNIFENK